MAISNRLQMIFQSTGGSRNTISLLNPKEDLTEEEVKVIMEDIIAKNIFISKDGDLVNIVGARIVSTETTDIIEQ